MVSSMTVLAAGLALAAAAGAVTQDEGPPTLLISAMQAGSDCQNFIPGDEKNASSFYHQYDGSAQCIPLLWDPAVAYPLDVLVQPLNGANPSNFGSCSDESCTQNCGIASFETTSEGVQGCGDLSGPPVYLFIGAGAT